MYSNAAFLCSALQITAIVSSRNSQQNSQPDHPFHACRMQLTQDGGLSRRSPVRGEERQGHAVGGKCDVVRVLHVRNEVVHWPGARVRCMLEHKADQSDLHGHSSNGMTTACLICACLKAHHQTAGGRTMARRPFLISFSWYLRVCSSVPFDMPSGSNRPPAHVFNALSYACNTYCQIAELARNTFCQILFGG